MSGTYRYTENNLLQQPFHYMYTPFEGEAFLRAYLDNRRGLSTGLMHESEEGSSVNAAAPGLRTRLRAVGLEKPDFDVFPSEPGSGPFRTTELLTDLLHLGLYEKLEETGFHWAERLLHRFEVTKRLYGSYDSAFRPLDADYHVLENYVWLSAILMLMHEEKPSLKFLNAVLKLNDLVASADPESLDSRSRAAFSAVLDSELRSILSLARSHEVVI